MINLEKMEQRLALASEVTLTAETARELVRLAKFGVEVGVQRLSETPKEALAYRYSKGRFFEHIPKQILRQEAFIAGFEAARKLESETEGTSK